MEIEDITIKLLKTEIPIGKGRVNKIITVDSKRSIIQIRNKDAICLARSIVVGLAVQSKEKFKIFLEIISQMRNCRQRVTNKRRHNIRE